MSIEPTTVVIAMVAVLSLALNVAAFFRAARKDELAELKKELADARRESSECEAKHAAIVARFDGLRDENIHLMRLVLGLDPASGQHLSAGS